MLSQNNKVFSVGRNNVGQLGLGNLTGMEIFTKVDIEIVKDKEDISYIICGGEYNFLLTKKNRIFSCGNGANGNLAHDNTQV